MKKLVPNEAVLIPDNAECVFKGIIYDVYHWPQKLFDGSTATFEMLRRADTVSVICIVDDKIVVLQDEQPHRGVRASFPGGRVEEADGDIVTAAKREVAEETGYSFKNWKLIKVAQPFTKIEWFIYELVAWECTGRSEPHADAGEKITVQELDFDTVRRLVLDREGYLGESTEFFETATSAEGFTRLPDFAGKEVTV